MSSSSDSSIYEEVHQIAVGAQITPTHATKNTSKKGATDRSSLPPKFGVDTGYWSEYNDLADDYDKEWTETLNSHLDNLLIFAGLFAGINTAFTVISLGLLQPTPSDDTNDLLRLFLRSQSVNVTTDGHSWELETVAVQTSYLFSASLSCTLLAALGGLVGKQWVVSYQRPGKTKTADQRAMTRQKKYDGVKAYYFRSLLDALSFLIQLAVLLFLMGFMLYLWDLHHGVAIMVIVITLAGFVGYMITLVAASFDEFCPFQTPLSTLFRKIWFSSRPYLRFSARPYLRSISAFVAEKWSGCTGVQVRTRHLGTNRDLEKNASSREDGGDESGGSVENGQDAGLDVAGKQPQTSELEDSINDTNLESYVRSIRWIFKTASKEETLLEAAWNLPTLRQVALTKVIFHIQESALRRFFGSIRAGIRSIFGRKISTVPKQEIIYETPTYERLILLLQDSLVRLLLAGDVGNSEEIEDTLVYGRAILHCLIQSNRAAEGFKLLASRLKNYIPYGWRSTRGELRMLLTCVRDELGYWEHEEDMRHSKVNLSVLPIYMASIAIGCPPKYYGRWIRCILEQWLKSSRASSGTSEPKKKGSHITYSAMDATSTALSTSAATPRVLGLAAIGLVRGRLLQNTEQEEELAKTAEMIQPLIWQAYEGDNLVFQRICEALKAYPGLHFVPSPVGKITSKELAVSEYPPPDTGWSAARSPSLEENQAYTAFIRALGHSLDMLVDGNDEYQLPLHRKRREQHRQELSGQLGKEIFGTLGKILDAVLREDSISDVESVSAHRELLEEVVIVLGKASSIQGWRSSQPSLPPSLIWQVASRVRRESRALPHTLTLMQSAELRNESYNDLFLGHPQAASMLMMALYDHRSKVRRTSSELLQNHGQEWLDIIDDHHHNLFGDHTFATALANHIMKRENGDDPDPVYDIVISVQHRPELIKTLLEKLYHAVVGADTSSKIDKREVLETSIEIWVQLLDDMQDDSRNRWSSASMMMVINEHIKTLKEEYEKLDHRERRQERRNLPSWLKKYYEHVSQNRDSSATPVMYWLTESMRHYEEVLGQGYGN